LPRDGQRFRDGLDPELRSVRVDDANLVPAVTALPVFIVYISPGSFFVNRKSEKKWYQLSTAPSSCRDRASFSVIEVFSFPV
jgi:hypothetical protein